jgi:ACS family allantoate permease-like MFS transporter
MGIHADAGFTTGQITWLRANYYAIYIVAGPIYSRFFQTYLPSKWIAPCVIVWGIVPTCMADCHNFAGLMVTESFLEHSKLPSTLAST